MKETSLIRYVREFEKNKFWAQVMKPAMEAAIANAKEALVYCDDVKEIRAMQAGIKMTQTWMRFPGAKANEAKDDLAFDQATKDQEGEEADESPS